MKKILFALTIASVLVFSLATAVFAAEGQPPVGSCSAEFVLHSVGMHAAHHHHHIGITVDLNKDTYICVKELGNGLHVHVDNVIR